MGVRLLDVGLLARLPLVGDDPAGSLFRVPHPAQHIGSPLVARARAGYCGCLVRVALKVVRPSCG
jgi:hypothetical protein